jgi:trigger factor
VIVSRDIAHLEHSAVQLTLTVGASDLRKQYDELIAGYAKNIQLPGFRKGKVPKDVLERKFGASLKGEALGKIMEKSVQEAFEAEDFPADARPMPYSTPSVKEEPALDFDTDLTFSVVYDVFPVFALGPHKGLEIEAPAVDIGAEDLNRELEQVRERNAVVLDKDEAAPTANGDVVTVSYCELDEAASAIPGTERQDFVFTVGSGYNIYKFDEDIIGMKKGESRDLAKTYGADFSDADLAGKSKRIRVTLQQLKEKKLPDLDDDLAQDVNEKYKTLADLKADLKANLEKTAEARLREMKVNSLLEKIAEATTVSVPESMVRIELESRWRNLARRFNASPEQLLKNLETTGKTYEGLLEEWKPDVEKALKSRLVVDALIKEYAVEASDEDVEKEFHTMAASMNMGVEEIKKHYEQENMKSYMKEDIKERKLFDLLLGESKIKKGKKMKYLDLVGNNG